MSGNQNFPLAPGLQCLRVYVEPSHRSVENGTLYMKKRLEALWCALLQLNKNATGYTSAICRILLCLLSYWLLTVVSGSRREYARAVVFVLLIG